MDAQLLFDQPAQQDGHLLFGAVGGPPPVAGDDVRATPAGQFPPLGGHVGVAQPERHQARPEGSFPGIGGQVGAAFIEVLRAQPAGGFPPLAGHVGAAWRSGVARPLVRAAASDAQPAQPLRQPLAGQFAFAQASGQRSASRAQQARPLPLPAWAGAWASTQRAGAGTAGRMQDARPLQWGGQYRWQQAQALHLQRSSRAQQAQSARQQWRWAFETAILLRALLAGRAQQALPLALAHADGARLALLLRSPPWAGRWQLAMPAPPALRRLDDGSAQPQPQGCYTPSAQLVFCRPSGGADLLFECGICDAGAPQARYAIPALEVYMQRHELRAYLLPGMEPVELTEVALAADDDSYCWSLSATGPASLLDQLAPVGGEPPRLLVRITGIDFVFCVTSVARTRAFAQQRASIEGVSVTALLGAPHMAAQTWLSSQALTAQQLAAQALEYTGTALDWQITDWQVPAGAWSYQGTPLQAVLRIAEAVGAVVRSHRTEQRLIVAPRYTALPWEWASATPDVQMAADVIVTDELRPAPRPDYNAIYVAGGPVGGVMGHVVRSGSARDRIAPMVQDDLITHADAARMRGSWALAAAGHWLEHTISMPVLTGQSPAGGQYPGVLQPGQLLHVQDVDGPWRGLVRAVRVQAALPRVRQSVTVERMAAP
ncbi:hypothetical protein CK623_11375 [Vandammella animalimorsus]|uniref:Uncharacterized protein n=1 Tax=Vandammella animalimorsus TaxID=2029117 RepID=A0A2A2AMV3_9BURK|nr:hypothetical protein CK623_11375 [Vandammella animalimorsus]